MLAPGWLLRDWSRPSFVVDPAIRTTSIQFYLGPEGSGAQPHWHGPASVHLRLDPSASPGRPPLPPATLPP